MDSKYTHFILDTETEAFAPGICPPPPYVVGGYVCGFEHNSPITIMPTDAPGRRFFRDLVKEVLDDGKTVVGHNLAFDLAVLGIVPAPEHRLHDTMISDVLLRLARTDCDENKPGPPLVRDLKTCANVPMFGKADTRLSFKRGVPPTLKQLAYLEQDIRVTAKLCQRQLKQGVPGGWREQTLQVRAAMALNRLELEGIPVDMFQIQVARAAQQKRRATAAAHLKEVGLYRPERTGPRGGVYKASLDTKTFRLYVKSLSECRGIPLELTKKGQVATKREFLLEFQQNEVVGHWLDYKDSEKIINTFLNAWEEGDGKVHSRYNLLVRTGRVSASKPNITQVPSRGKRGELKKVFVSPDGWEFYELDFTQLELCTLAFLTQGRMADLINAGHDLHRALGAVFFDKPLSEVTKEERQLMKCANFGLPGGMGPAKFRSFIRTNGLPDPGDTAARDLINAWLAAYPEMQDWLRDDCDIHKVDRWVWAGKAEDYNISYVREDKAWENAHVRLYELPTRLPKVIWAQLHRGEGSAGLECWLTHRDTIVCGGRKRCPVSYTEQRNTRFQGLAANLAKEALASVAFSGLTVKIHAFVHDSILISVVRGDTETPRKVAELMLASARKHIPGIRAGVEICGPGDSWYGAKTGPEQQLFV